MCISSLKWSPDFFGLGGNSTSRPLSWTPPFRPTAGTPPFRPGAAISLLGPLLGGLLLLAVEVPLDQGGSDDDHVADNAVEVGDFTEEDNAEEGGEDDLGVIEDGDLFGGSIGVGLGDKDLTHDGTETGEKEEDRLLEGHGLEVQEDKGKEGENGGNGEVEDDHVSVHAIGAQAPNKGVGGAAAEATEEADEGGDTDQATGRLDHEGRTDEGREDADDGELVGLLVENEDGHDDGKEGGHLLEDAGITQVQVFNGEEVGEKADGAKEAAPQHGKPVLWGEAEANMGMGDENKGVDQGHHVPENRLLQDGHIAT